MLATISSPRSSRAGHGPRATSARAAMASLAAFVLGAFLIVAPASAATVGAQWLARVGPAGANGTATIRVDTSGAGGITLTLRGLARRAPYAATLYRGTCAARSAKIVALPSLKTSASGTFVRTSALTPSQAAVVNTGSAALWLAAGGHVICGTFAQQAGASVVTTCDQGHLASALARGGTVRFACDGTIALTSTIAITKSVVLDASDRSVVVDGGGAVGLFSVAGGVSLGIVGLTLQNGRSSDAGGAIDARKGGAVSIANATLVDNQAASGGAVATAAAGLTVVGSTFVDDTATSGDGGAIDAGSVAVTNSTFSGNQAALGGAIHASTGLAVVNTTFVDNASTGPAISLHGGAASLRNTILAGDSGTECALGTATLGDQGGNISTDGSCGLTAATSRNGIPVAALDLGPLADNGGPTQTIALLPGSVATDGGVACPPPAADQRGVPRPQGAACDSGAFELEPPPGYDISFPQCSGSFPITPAFEIVGVNGGRAFTPNPCLGVGDLQSELAWAGGPSAQLYANTGNPGPTLSAHWPTGQATPRACSAGAPPVNDTTDCAYDYGWYTAGDSYQDAVNAYIALGLAPPGATRTPTPNAWWLDVETGNSWRDDVSLNVAALQGAVAYLQSVGAASVGFYSTTYQWTQITGGTQVFATAPNWVAGARSSVQARANCKVPGFGGGPVTLVQFAANGFDADLHCTPGA